MYRPYSRFWQCAKVWVVPNGRGRRAQLTQWTDRGRDRWCAVMGHDVTSYLSERLCVIPFAIGAGLTLIRGRLSSAVALDF